MTSDPTQLIVHTITNTDPRFQGILSELCQDLSEDNSLHKTHALVDILTALKLLRSRKGFKYRPYRIVGANIGGLGSTIETGPWRFRLCEGGERATLHLHLGEQTIHVSDGTIGVLATFVQRCYRREGHANQTRLVGAIETLADQTQPARVHLQLLGLVRELRERMAAKVDLDIEALISRFHLDPLPLQRDQSVPS